MVQVMDLETYQILEMPFPEDQDAKAKLAPSSEVEYWRISDMMKIMRVKG
jgi:translation initiation factor 5A